MFSGSYVYVLLATPHEQIQFVTWSIAEKLEEQRKSQEASCASDQYGLVSKRVFPSIRGPIHIVQILSHGISLAFITCLTAMFSFGFPQG